MELDWMEASRLATGSLDV